MSQVYKCQKYLGKFVRLNHEMHSSSPIPFAEGLVMKVESVHRGKLALKTIGAKPRRITGVLLFNVALMHQRQD